MVSLEGLTLTCSAFVQDLAFKPAEGATVSIKGGSKSKQETALGKSTAGQGILLLEPPSVPTAPGGNEIGAIDDETELLLDGKVSRRLPRLISHD